MIDFWYDYWPIIVLVMVAAVIVGVLLFFGVDMGDSDCKTVIMNGVNYKGQFTTGVGTVCG